LFRCCSIRENWQNKSTGLTRGIVGNPMGKHWSMGRYVAEGGRSTVTRGGRRD
jgi:hypothetical protein